MISLRGGVFLDSRTIIAGIIARKESLKLTARQLADEANLPESTVNRILRGETQNPSLQATLDLARAVGYSLGEPSPREEPPAIDSTDSRMKHIVYLYERQLSELRERHRQELDRADRQANARLAEKDRWLSILFTIIVVVCGGVVAICLIDIMNPYAGWVQPDQPVKISVPTAILIAAVVIAVVLILVKFSRKRASN